ncbi:MULTISPECIES: hypothetical protein [Pseudomonas]|uniref:hypothetical protein n=1 Tax=Pseudomonas TaxID=286 RepID=UPI0002A156B1|nr:MULTISPECIES: hypothetical protein [Pseudomonas]AGA72983.1 hypothetical protein B479_10405 [Pseudomonas putida HB3267]MCE0946202.1 hypothetical protein [Pseudomonas asiatica]MCE1067187.1 hypothetical protein [Pseudomonas asiatica]MCE1101986.1 hypothetical protein [Pseudomonas asiatica]MCE1107520.1 hypothetical protein [Pseudomonas asiatica]
MAAQEPPEIDDVVSEVLEAYAAISRSRQYVGMIGAPAPIALTAVNEYFDRRPSAICREEIDAAIFALDDEFRRNWNEQQQKDQPKESRRKK